MTKHDNQDKAITGVQKTKIMQSLNKNMTKHNTIIKIRQSQDCNMPKTRQSQEWNKTTSITKASIM